MADRYPPTSEPLTRTNHAHLNAPRGAESSSTPSIDQVSVTMGFSKGFGGRRGGPNQIEPRFPPTNRADAEFGQVAEANFSVEAVLPGRPVSQTERRTHEGPPSAGQRTVRPQPPGGACDS